MVKAFRAQAMQRIDSFTRSPEDRYLGGVCGGIGPQLGVDPTVIRLAVVVMTFANGVGCALYALAWAMLPEAAPGAPPPPRVAPTAQRAIGFGLITLGVISLMSRIGLLLPAPLVWSMAWTAVGCALVWARTSDEERGRWLGIARGRTGAPVDTISGGRSLVLRAIVGGVLVVVGLAFLFASGGWLSVVGQLGIAVVATGLGVALLLGPWMVRLWRGREEERRQRIRSEERSEMAAHLHDSVLQTLTLIQRHADQPARARMLARRQERELRGWLYDGRPPPEGRPDTLVAALEAVVTEVEDRHVVEIDLVVVGECTLDRRVEGLISAVREAAHNAARHAGVPEVSVYVEAEGDKLTAFVRDRGRGFDLDEVGPGRLGVRESIIGRMARVGGRAEVHSTKGEGTEIVLEVPLAQEAAT
jgi:signal transduction histidine kinase/phage shock protein PspC (stress-responsive transcriptional regulator)